jgi:hypothetical protein
MTNSIAYSVKRNLRHILLDAGAITVIYFVPAFSHMVGISVYLFEPMRIMLFVSFMFSSRNNSYIIALSLPLFSFLISSHPSLIKSGLIAIELTANVFLFYLFAEMLRNKFTAAFLSIVISKILYYFLKFAFISLALMEGSVISTPIYIQVIVTVFLSIIVYLGKKSGSDKLAND